MPAQPSTFCLGSDDAYVHLYSTSLTWTLFALATYPDVQVKLRDELRYINSDTPTLDELASCRYLDAVVREVLRLHAPVPFTERIVTRADIIPLENAYVDTKGEVQNTVRYDRSYSDGSKIC